MFILTFALVEYVGGEIGFLFNDDSYLLSIVFMCLLLFVLLAIVFPLGYLLFFLLEENTYCV